MIIQLIPQAITFEGYIKYSFIDEVLEIELKYHEDLYNDLFDFSGLPDGILDTTRIESELPINPIISALKANGVFEIEILFWSNMDEQDERLLFPKPMTLDEFNDLMDELADRDKVEEGIEDGENGLENR